MRGIWRICEMFALPLLWGGGVYGAISLQDLAVADAHTICGPWGCGPTTGPLLAMHVGWLALLGPPLLYLPGRIGLSSKFVGWLSAALVATGLIGITAIVAWQWLVWLPKSGDWSREYIWQRCAFAVAIAIDWPLIQLTLLGTTLAISRRLWRRRGVDTSAVEPEDDLPLQLNRMELKSVVQKHSGV